ncbi:hypothetical protein SCLCIDRAFT_1218245 [Scleroderma citrinum Foug A]|uniref:Uncharacterized protein n=1 Tax=Scleroderma citrinum Foug A TaxID=1036808 RepID=A0A0C3DRR1_9AGAM|nr:hypothetical protein SCLCIDRAFT_1218245 [Scleroderma citrinum Foug A]
MLTSSPTSHPISCSVRPSPERGLRHQASPSWKYPPVVTSLVGPVFRGLPLLFARTPTSALQQPIHVQLHIIQRNIKERGLPVRPRIPVHLPAIVGEPLVLNAQRFRR